VGIPQVERPAERASERDRRRVVIAEDMAGGEWEQYARHIYVESAGWIRGHHVPTAIHTVRNHARLADNLGTKGALYQLERSLHKLDREIEIYENNMRSLRKEVGYLIAVVLRARDEAADTSDDEREERRIQQLLEQSDVGIDDDIIRRAANLHRPER
ncbi:MAG TPA: hypothetical protein VIG24_02900, partial [Acidimicrobiia bacterium]